MRIRWIATALALLALAAGTVHAADAGPPRKPHPVKPAFPQIALPEAASRGERALQLLGHRSGEVASWYRKSDEEFRALLRNDRRLHIDRRGRMFVVDELEAPLAAAAASAAENSVLTGALLPLDQTFLLHSRPGASRTIYLNFRGATLTNTAWNGSAGTITALPFDLDGIPYSFNTTELQRIQYIWQRVAEDYAPLDVDVTTEAPPADVLTRSSGADQVFGTTVLITNSNGVYSCSCGGVAYIGIFDETTDFYKPALVFYNQLGAGNEKYVAEAISHEAGHNVGLQHDGYSGGAYYSGQGSGATGWAPIMGVGYYQSLVQWSKGEYSTANNTEDDYGVMAANGLSQRTDDHGNTIGTATLLTGSASGGVTTYVATGVIERPGDIDLFGFTAAAGTVTVTSNPAARSPNLDVLIVLRDAAGNLLASANPADTLNASLSFTVALPGTYYLGVQGVGKGDPLTTGYTNYGSLGNYALSITSLTVNGTPPVAVATATPSSGTVPLTVSFSAAGSSDADGVITAYGWTFGDGTSATGATASHVYNAAGTFTALLTVTDNSGLSATKSVSITVDPVVTLIPMSVSNIGMSLVNSGGGRMRANAAVTMLDSSGRALSGVTVTGRWSGIVSGNVSGRTASNGTITFASPTTRSRGTFTFTVTGATLSGYQYDSAHNVETSDSITR